MDLRALVQIDRLQPQFAAYNGATVQGSIPLAGDTILVGEMGPGNEVFRVVDVALKASDVQATSQIVEREFGFFILRSPANAEVSAAREAILSHLGVTLTERRRPKVKSSQIITSVEPYQAQLLNKWRSGALLVPGETLHVSLGPKIYQLPVELKLKDFEVERNDGSDTPAGFKSTLEVRDASGDVATGSCSMNEPMNFPDVLWRRWTGFSYKISQASWNPHDLHQSSVQILFDPGWFFKWVGSLLVCTGIFTMFYLRPTRKFQP